MRPGAPPDPSAGSRPSRWPARGWHRRRRDAWFLFGVLLINIVTILVFLVASPALEGRGIGARPTAPAIAPTGTAGKQPTSSGSVAVRPAQVHAYRLPGPNAGLMQPAIGKHGDLWVGEMLTNRLARLDMATGVVTGWEPPNGRSGVMDEAIDRDGNVWFAEQSANYIGRFDPTTQAFSTYPLGAVEGQPAGPQDLQFDAAGNLWFTELTGGQIGRLDPATGAIQTWPVPAPAPGQPAYPFALAVTRSGQVWFGDLGGGVVGRLESATGQVTLSHLADPQAQVFAMVSDDARGRVWLTEVNDAKLGVIDTATGKVTELDVPNARGNPVGLYGVVVAPDGDVWFASNGANALVRYAPGANTFTFSQLAVSHGVPYGLAIDLAGHLWFTADGSPANYVGEMSP